MFDILFLLQTTNYFDDLSEKKKGFSSCKFIEPNFWKQHENLQFGKKQTTETKGKQDEKICYSYRFFQFYFC